MTQINENKKIWGISIKDQQIQVVSLVKDEDTLKILSQDQLDISECNSWSESLKCLDNTLQDISREDHVAVSMPNHSIFFQNVELPNAETVALDSMVRSQSELILPDNGDGFNISWSQCQQHIASEEGMCKVLMCASKKDDCDTIINKIKPHTENITLLAEASCIADYCKYQFDKEDVVVNIELEANFTNISLFSEGELIDACVLQNGTQEWVEYLVDVHGRPEHIAKDYVYKSNEQFALLENVVSRWSRLAASQINEMLSRLHFENTSCKLWLNGPSSIIPQIKPYLNNHIDYQYELVQKLPSSTNDQKQPITATVAYSTAVYIANNNQNLELVKNTPRYSWRK